LAATVPRPVRAPHAPLPNRVIGVPQAIDAAWGDFAESRDAELRLAKKESAAEDSGNSPEAVANVMSRLRHGYGALRQRQQAIVLASEMNVDDELIDSVLSKWR